MLGYMETTSCLKHQIRNGVKYAYLRLRIFPIFNVFGNGVRLNRFGRPTVNSNGTTALVLEGTRVRTTGGMMKKDVISQCHVLDNVTHDLPSE